MKITLAIAIARQQVDPEFKGHRFENSGIYRARNGQFLTGPRSIKNCQTWKTFEQFLEAYDWEYHI